MFFRVLLFQRGMTYRHQTALSPYERRKSPLHAQPDEAIYIGDTMYDSQCAYNAGIDFALAVWGNGSKEEIKAKYTFHSPLEVWQTFKSDNA